MDVYPPVFWCTAKSFSLYMDLETKALVIFLAEAVHQNAYIFFLFGFCKETTKYIIIFDFYAVLYRCLPTLIWQHFLCDISHKSFQSIHLSFQRTFFIYFGTLFK